MQKISSHDIYNLFSLTQLNSDGFFVKTGISRIKNEYTAKIFRLKADLNVEQCTKESFSINPIKINNSLYYLANIDSKMQLIKMSLNSDRKKQLTFGDTASNLISSKNKKKLFFKTTKMFTVPKFSVTKFPKTRYINKLDNRADGFGWKDNQTLYYLYALDVQTGKINLLKTTYQNFKILDVDDIGANILISRSVFSNEKSISQIYQMNLVNMNKELITTIDGNFNEAIYSPDGKNILLVGNYNNYGSSNTFNLYLFNVNEKKLINLTKNLCDIEPSYNGGLATDFVQNRSNQGIKWLNNHQYIFHATHHGRSQLYLGQNNSVQKIYDDKTEIYDFSILDNKKLLLSVSAQKVPNQLIIFDFYSNVQKLIYDPNEKFTLNHEFCNSYKFSTISQDNLFNINGWLLLPNQKKDKYPTILYIHGGPHETYGESFFYEFQFLANHGYAILFINPRGSSSYGQAFEKASVGRVGKEDFADIMTGLDYALNKFKYLDHNNLFIAGGSYGGFMSSWIISHTDKFKAAIVQRPITDWHSFYGTSDIGVRFSKNELGVDLYDKDGLNFYWNHSPLKYVNNIHTPTRIQHGEWDMRCPVNQSEALFQDIKRNNVESDYIRYPQSFHGFSRNGLPNLRVTRINDVYEWFNEHLN
ncbi:S9 family peptidase [Apilactobacillus micheneri]|uniref:S9 family peptidase n=1 Tax=Apilactobacillus micheneri TaxID=1899430 RepID=A0A9Q8IPW0_9LACO|nr:S9 family peptidase [Apilactobacillus micheneri]TPR41010.1 S9 family peptidase [Apilactobacillus micheneri]TPR46117.1 S9 family peptidase [Apilactobacillus micheneri]TPR46802.1 S9 family peptidase [Apilactobacillus micheneri]